MPSLEGATVEASYIKHCSEDRRILHSEIVKRLRQWLRDRQLELDDILFPISKRTCGVDRRTSKAMMQDLKAARNI